MFLDMSVWGMLLLGGFRGASFTSAAVLAKALGPGRLAVIVPETLFEGDHCGSYELLLRAKAGVGGLRLLARRGEGWSAETVEDKLVGELVGRGFECWVVPHPGIASPLRVEALEGGEVRVSKGGARRFGGYRFGLVFTALYRILSRYAREALEAGRGSLCIDLTHGTNLVVNALMLAAAAVRAVYGVEVRLYAAPLMASPRRAGSEVEVEILDLTDALEAVEDVIGGALAWRRLDERLLPLEPYEAMGERLGPRYKSLYGTVKTLLKDAEELLWGLRSGQAAVLHERVGRLAAKASQAEVSLEKMVTEEIPLDQKPHPAEWAEHSSDPPWPALADAVITLTKELTGRLAAGSNVEYMVKALEELARQEHLDKLLGIAREWIVALHIAARTTKDRVSMRDGHEWDRSELELRCTPQLRDIFDKARQYRNRLMHGRISKEESLTLEIREGDVRLTTSEGKPPSLIKKEELARIAEELLDIVKKLSTKVGEAEKT